MGLHGTIKKLQSDLTSTAFPWVPTGEGAPRRLINEIVLAEESDVIESVPISHFECYIEAMKEAGAQTGPITGFIYSLKHGKSVHEALNEFASPASVKFVNNTLDQINGKCHEVAAAFTFGREDIIPEVFVALMKNSHIENLPILKSYLERHIEIDGGEHGPAAMKLVNTLCGDDTHKWEEATLAASKALKSRIALWDDIYENLRTEP